MCLSSVNSIASQHSSYVLECQHYITALLCIKAPVSASRTLSSAAMHPFQQLYTKRLFMRVAPITTLHKSHQPPTLLLHGLLLHVVMLFMPETFKDCSV